MTIITLRSQIRALPERLKKAWQRPDGAWMRIVQQEPDCEKIHAAVAALDPETATIDDVTAAMGFDGSWIGTKCNECGRENVAVVELGEAPDYESSTAHVCAACLRKALDIIPMVVCDGWLDPRHPRIVLRDGDPERVSHGMCQLCSEGMKE